MENPKTDWSSQSLTAPYRPSDATDRRPPVEVVARSARENDLVPLLRRRLRFLLFVFALLYLTVLLLPVSYYAIGSHPLSIDLWASAVTFVVCLGLAAFLSG